MGRLTPRAAVARSVWRESANIAGYAPLSEFADATAPLANTCNYPRPTCIQVPDNVSTDAAVFTEPLAAALDIVHRLAPKSGDRVLVVGAGRLGQLVCRVLGASGAHVVALGRNPDKLARLQGVAASTQRAEDIEPRSFNMAVECTGNPSGLPVAISALRPQGTLVLKSTYAEPLKLDTAPLVVDELQLVGSRCGPFDAALRLARRATGGCGIAHRCAISPVRGRGGLRP